jgi:hypothetical protein
MAKSVDAIYDPLVDMFKCVENFLRRLATYTEIEPSSSIAGTVANIMVKLLSVLALATKQTTQGQLSKSSLTDEYS